MVGAAKGVWIGGLHEREYIYIFIYRHTFENMYVRVVELCIFKYVYVYVDICMQMQIYACKCVWDVYVYVYIYIIFEYIRKQACARHPRKNKHIHMCIGL